MGLAVSTAIAAAVQVVLLATRFSQTGSPLAWRQLFSTLAGMPRLRPRRCQFRLLRLPGPAFPAVDGMARVQQAMQLGTSIALGIAVYLIAAGLLGSAGSTILLRRPRDSSG